MPLKALLDSLISQIPKGLFSLERQKFIGSLLDSQTQETKKVLKEALDGFLLKMLETEASDIDLGGVGCAGRVPLLQ